MISKQQIKFLQSLHRSKFRKQHNQFIIEGEKIVREAIVNACDIECIYATSEWIEKNDIESSVVCLEVSDKDMHKLSQLSTASMVAALVNMPKQSNNLELQKDKWYLALESVRDPGNMGTIIRTADWFGVNDILLSSDCVEIYNGKVLQSTMGSFFRVNCYTEELKDLVLKSKEMGIPIYATSLNGEDINQLGAFEPGIILFGNESKGLSVDLQELATNKILIPGRGGAESLNVGVAVGVVLSRI